MKNLRLLALAGIMLLLAPACGRKKQAGQLLSLQKDMTMGQVSLHMGEPDTVAASCVDKKGNEIDIWEYNLGIRDEEMHNTKVLFQVGGWILFWPLLCFPQAWRSSWTYETYFLKFVNKLLAQWGRKADIINIQKEYSQVL
jgi:hypothetical protein